MADARHTLLTLLFTPGLGPRKIRGLLEHFGDTSTLLTARVSDLRAVEGIGPRLAETIFGSRSEAEKKAEAEIGRAERLKVTLLALGEVDYPSALALIYDPPPILYVRGTLPAGVHGEMHDLRSLGVVGTRNASPYGLEISRRFSRELAGAGVSIVSGLALGVDSAAHDGALGAPQGKTVAVLGSSVDIIYPGQNRGLAERILQGHGAIVSEYRLGTTPRAENFPGRNRIISGLSRGVLVVEGGRKSGALITADYALEEGRSIFAVPGRLGDPKAEGALELLKQGAILAGSPEDIVHEFGWQGGAATPVRAQPTGFAGELTQIIRERGEALLDDLIAATGKGASDLLPTLMTLELDGVVRSLPNGRYTV